jgi:Zn-dependent oligopeptidase
LCPLISFQHALAVHDTHFNLAAEPLVFYQNVSPSKELRDASNEADALLRDYAVDASLRVDVFNAKVAAERNIKASGKVLTPEEQRLVDKMILEGKRDGLALPESEREELKKLQKALSQTSLEFSVSLMLFSS